MKKIETLQIELTRYCNLRCVHCYLVNKLEKGLLVQSKEDLNKLIAFINYIKPENIGITGGEPLLFADKLFNIFKQLRYNITSIHINTNCVIDIEKHNVKNLFSLLNEKGIGTLEISLDGLKNTHNRIRGDTFDIVVSNIKKIKENYKNIKIKINTIITSYLLEELEEFLDFVINYLNIEEVNLAPVFKTDTNRYYDFLFPKEALELAYKFSPDAFKKYDSCSALEGKKLHIDIYGNIYPCSMIPISIGNIYVSSPDQIMNFEITRSLNNFKKPASCIGYILKYGSDNIKFETLM